MKRITGPLVLLCIFVLSACAPKTFVWDDLLLKDVLPSLETDKGEVVSNTDSGLLLRVEGFSEKQYNDYVQQCKEKGFLTDADTTFGYEAFNDQGYGLRLSYYSSRGEMTIDLEAPRQFGDLEWPTQGIAASVPAPKSKIGKIEWEHSDSFLIYVAETSKEEYREYVERCAEAGFNIDYDKDENYYRADNEDGYSIDIDYEGFDVIRIRVDAPIEEDNYEEVLTEPSESASEPEESVSETVDNMKNDWETAFKDSGFSDEEIAEYKEILTKVGITDYHDVEVIENGIMHIVLGKIYDAEDLQLNVTLENRKIIYIELTGLPATDTEAYINWRGKVTFRTVNTTKSVALYDDIEGGYLAALDWENKEISEIE